MNRATSIILIVTLLLFGASRPAIAEETDGAVEVVNFNLQGRGQPKLIIPEDFCAAMLGSLSKFHERHGRAYTDELKSGRNEDYTSLQECKIKFVVASSGIKNVETMECSEDPRFEEFCRKVLCGLNDDPVAKLPSRLVDTELEFTTKVRKTGIGRGVQASVMLNQIIELKHSRRNAKSNNKNDK